jgi:reverse gyrase
MNISIKFINGICGAGKTYAIAAWADSLADRGHKVLLVQPTTQLVQETIQTTFPAMNVDMTRVVSITSKTHEKVMKSIDEHLKTTDSQTGEILVITHSAFFGLSYFHSEDRSGCGRYHGAL